MKNLKELDFKKATTAEYEADQARGAYVAAVCRPDVTYTFSDASQIAEPKEKYISVLKRYLHHAFELI